MKKKSLDDVLKRCVENLCPKRGSGIDTVTITLSGPNGHSVTLTPETGERLRKERITGRVLRDIPDPPEEILK
jgi:hypothetical protein